LYAGYLTANGKQPIAQEYIPHEAGEFTVGVLSAPDGAVLGAIAMKRVFPAKISVLARGTDFLISSGTSQGHIGEYPDICSTAREMARALGSTGPMNIQGRLRPDGRFVPFEINPRFSATTYLRALAGFNEVDHHVSLLIGKTPAAPLLIRPGWYLRSLTELYVPDEEIRR
jgi:carbamoyl-phosphate synthase large subunit